MNGRGHQSLEKAVLLVEQQIDPPGQSIVQHGHHDHTRGEKADVVRRLHDLTVSGALKEVAEENQPKQHRLDEGEEHAELLTTQPPHPAHGQCADFLPVLAHDHDGMAYTLFFLRCGKFFTNPMAGVGDEDIVQARAAVLDAVELAAKSIRRFENRRERLLR